MGLGQTDYTVDFEGRVTAFRYDNRPMGGGRPVATHHYLTEAEYLADRADGVLGASRERTLQEYDAWGRDLRTTTWREGAAAPRVTTRAYDAEGRTLEIASSEGTVRYEYDALGRPTAVSTGDAPTPTTRVEYGYDLLNRLQTVTEAWRGGVDVADSVTSYRYDAAGRLDAVVRPGGVVSDYAYDDLGRLDTLTDFHDTDGDTTRDANEVVLARYDYDLRADGKRSGVTETDDLGRTTRIDWAYDSLGRLTRERYDSWDDALDFTADYLFDLASNRVEKRIDRGSDGSIDAVTRSTHDAGDRQLSETLNDLDDSRDRFTRFAFTGTQQTRKSVHRGLDDTAPLESDTFYEFNLPRGAWSVLPRALGLRRVGPMLAGLAGLV